MDAAAAAILAETRLVPGIAAALAACGFHSLSGVCFLRQLGVDGQIVERVEMMLMRHAR
jgi:hypothetical protein